MFKFRVFLTVLLLLAALFSVQSQAMGDSHNLTTHVSASTVLTELNDFSKTPPIAKSHSDQQHKKSHQTGLDAHQPRLTANNSSLFLHSMQSEPEYDVVFEFFAQHLVRHIFLRPTAVKPIQPWYTLLTHSKKSRLSGWKDVNLLYKASITYHA
jgi:hypothetical protein